MLGCSIACVGRNPNLTTEAVKVAATVANASPRCCGSPARSSGAIATTSTQAMWPNQDCAMFKTLWLSPPAPPRVRAAEWPRQAILAEACYMPKPGSPHTRKRPAGGRTAPTTPADLVSTTLYSRRFRLQASPARLHPGSGRPSISHYM